MVGSRSTTTTGTEKELQDLMYSHTAASVAGVCFSPAEWERFQAYTGGIFKACGPAAGGGETKKCQAVAVVGYGTEGGTNYWTMKNSWGAEWGERSGAERSGGGGEGERGAVGGWRI